MATNISQGARALAAFAKGKLPVDLDLAREGAAEVIAEVRRLREILTTMQRGGLGEAALVEMLKPTKDATLRFVVCCASKDEEALARAVQGVMARVFARLGADLTPMDGTVTGTLAMDAEAPDGAEDGR